MKKTLIILGTLLLIVVIVTAVGYSLPEKHTASRERTYRASPDAVFAEITNAAAYPEWRTGVTRVEMLPPVDGRISFRESSSDGDITYVLEIVEPGRRVVSRIVGSDLPFGGSWTYELTPGPGRTLVQITENGEVYNPFFRFISRFILGHHGSMDRFLDDLERRLRPAAGPPKQ